MKKICFMYNQKLSEFEPFEISIYDTYKKEIIKLNNQTVLKKNN